MRRFPLWLAQEFEKQQLDIETVFFCDDGISESDGADLEERLTKAVVVREGVKEWSVEGFSEVLATSRPAMVVVFAHRLPDMMILAAARRLGIQTAYYQHGLYIPFMRREASLFISNIRKSFKYLCYALRISRLAPKFSWQFLHFVQVFIVGSKALQSGGALDYWLPDHCLVYGRHWVDYHVENYGYRSNQISVVGTPDLSGIDLEGECSSNQLASNQLICYVAQTLVEDGRISRGEMEKFLLSLAEALESIGIPLHVKLHPRSDLSLYENLPGEVKVSDSFIQAEIYVGHYSSMLIKGVGSTTKFLIVKLPGHQPPEYFDILDPEQVTAPCKPAELAERIETKLNQGLQVELWRKQKDRLNWFFNSNNEPAFQRAAHQLSKCMS